MIIGIDAFDIRPHSRGLGRSAEALVKALANRCPTPLVAFVPNEPELRKYCHDELAGVQCVLVNVPSNYTHDIRALWSQKILADALNTNKIKIDVLLCPAFDIPLAWPGPKVVVVHDRIFEYGSNFHPIEDVHNQQWARPCAQAAHHIITPSNFVRKDILDHWELPESKVTTVHWAPALSKSISSRSEACRQVWLEFGLHQNFVLYLGSSRIRKNIATLIKSFALISRKVPDVDLVLRTELDSSLVDLVNSLYLSKRVKFIGYCSQEVKEFLYSAATLFVFPSKAEGFGLPPLEAMMCGTPVIAVDTPPMSEILSDAACLAKDSEDTTELAQLIELLLTDGPFRQLMSARAVNRARQFSWESTAAAVTEILHSVG